MKTNTYLDNFIKVIEENIDHDNLTHFYNNLKTLDYRVRKINPHISFKSIVAGSYRSKTNRIDIYDDEESIIYHELLHMASSMYVDKKQYEGFCDMSFDMADYIIGSAINEGYTELLARRLFNIESTVCNGYEYATYIAMLLEKIVEKDNMQRYYFTANLPGLIDELCLYDSKDNIINFLTDSDYVLESLDKKIIVFRKESVLDALTDMNKFLATNYAKKMYQFYTDEKITKQEMIRAIYNYNDSLVDERYQITTKEDIYNYLSELFGLKDKTIVTDYKLIRIKEE